MASPPTWNGDQVCDQEAWASARQTPQSVTVPGRQRPPRALQHPAGEEGTQVHAGLRKPLHGARVHNPALPGDSHGGPQVNPSEKKKDKRGRTSRRWRDAERACRVPSLGLAIGLLPACSKKRDISGFGKFSEGTRPSCFIVSYILKFSSEMYT